MMRSRTLKDWALMVVLLVGVVASLVAVGATQANQYREIVDRVDHNTAVTVRLVDQTQQLLCDILVASDNPDIREAVKRHCPEGEP